jgi:acyl carrier protein
LSNSLEELKSIFETELRKHDIPVGKNFFEIGATSVILTKIHAKIRSEIGVELELVELYSAPTIRDLAKLLETRRSSVSAGLNG